MGIYELRRPSGMGNRGVDLAELKAKRAQVEADLDRDRLLMWAHAMVSWIASPLEEGGSDERLIAVPATGEEFVLTRRRSEAP